jgi:hypothetical protein
MIHDCPEPPELPSGSVKVAGTVLVTVAVIEVEEPPPQPTTGADSVVSAATNNATRFMRLPQTEMRTSG